MKQNNYYLSLFLVLFITCAPVKTKKVSFLKNRTYSFTDSSIRDIKLVFLNDSTIQICNLKYGIPYGRFGFKVKYSIKRIHVPIYRIDSLLEHSCPLSNEYKHPYRRLDNANASNLFPNVLGDTIIFNNNLKKIQLKDFTFDYIKNKSLSKFERKLCLIDE